MNEFSDLGYVVLCVIDGGGGILRSRYPGPPAEGRGMDFNPHSEPPRLSRSARFSNQSNANKYSLANGHFLQH